MIGTIIQNPTGESSVSAVQRPKKY